MREYNKFNLKKISNTLCAVLLSKLPVGSSAKIILGLFIVCSNSLSDYALGLVVGVTIGSYALSIYYFAALSHPKRLHQMYIAAYDERNKQILMATAVATLILEFLLIFALIALYAFVNIQLPYVTVLSVLLYGLVLGFALIRLILSKIG